MARTSSRILLALLVLTIALPAAAQQVRSVIKGVVKDKDGGVLPGATVTVNSPSFIQKNLSTTTNAKGEFRFPLLDPGVYSVKVDMQGFAASEVKGLRLLLNQTLEVPVVMEVQKLGVSIEVEGAPIVDKESTKSGTNFTKELLQSIPSARNLNSVIRFTPGAADDGQGGVATVHGSTERGNALQLDGVDVTDPVVGTQQVSFDFDNLEEIQVETGGHKAEYGDVSGAVVNSVTKSGGNNLSGEANAFYNNKSLVSKNGQDITARFPTLTPNILKKKIDTQGNLGGPISKDHIWFFGSFNYIDQATQVVGFTADSKQTQKLAFGKLTWQLNAKNKVVGAFNYDSLVRDNRGADAFHSVDTTRTQDGHETTPNLEYTSTFSPTTYLQVRAAFPHNRFDLRPKNDLPIHNNISTGQILDSAGIVDLNPRKRNQVQGSLSHYQQGWGGNHDFKFGFEYEASSAERDFSVNQGLYYYDTGTTVSTPTYVYEIGPSILHEKLRRQSAYAQDTWTIKNRLTLNLGVRYDRNTGGFPDQKDSNGNSFSAKTTVKTNDISPRIGLSVDPAGDGKSAIRFAYSRLVGANLTQYFDSVNPNAISGKGFVICGGPADDGTDCPPGAMHTTTPFTEFGAANTLIDPHLKMPVGDEFIVGMEREVFKNFSFGVNYIDKNEHRLPEDIEIAKGFRTLLFTDPGDHLVDSSGKTIETIAGGQVFQISDPIPGTPNQLFITNPGSAKREYRALELTATKRLSNRWQALGSFVISRSAGLIGTSFGNSTSISALYNRPDSLINAFGNLESSRPYQFKLQGLYQGPWGINMSGFFLAQSGTPFTRQLRVTAAVDPNTGAVVPLRGGPVVINAEPVGSHRLQVFDQLDLRLEKEFKIGVGRLGVSADVFNVFNSDAVLAVRNRSRGTIVLGDPTLFQSPRQVRVAARYFF